jgi:hypothetical protein
MHLALTDLYRARWTHTIHEEWIRAVLENRADLARAQLERTRDLMNAHARNALVENYEDLIPAHVLAAAIRGRADVIVTYNTRDFPPKHSPPSELNRSTQMRSSLTCWISPRGSCSRR